MTTAARIKVCPELGCKRLPAHKGEHRAALTKSANRKAAYATARKVAAAEDRKARKVARVTIVPEATGKAARRRVAAPAGVTRSPRYVTSGKPVLSRPSVG